MPPIMTPEEPVARGHDPDVGGPPAQALHAGGLRTLLGRVRDAFAAHRDEIDALNVFPVPDGDTGTNLLLTVRSALEEVGDETGAPAAPTDFARAAVMGARGNSGVIFSQVLRALAESLDRRSALDAGGLAEVLDRSREYAYDSVADPVEGTMLSAISAAAHAARTEVDGADDLAALVDRVGDEIQRAVQRTPQQLEVLRRAGVVDAGARGFEVFWYALQAHVHGRDPGVRRPPPVVERGQGPSAPRETGSLDYRFEVQYLLAGRDVDLAALRQRLRDLGDSVVVVEAGDVVNVHVHTNDVGAVIEEGLLVGRPSRIDVTYLEEQVAERHAATARSGVDGEPSGEVATGAVAVLPGAGLRAAAEALGATVVDAGAGDLPSVADVLNAVGEAPGEVVLIVPGHPNVLPTAAQAARVSEAEGGRVLSVVDEACSIPAALAALALYQPGVDAERLRAAMRDAADACAAGEVVRAVRDAGTPAGRVRRGQPLAVVRGEVVAVCDDAVSALRAVAVELDVGAAEVVTLVAGADADRALRDAAVAALEDLAPDAEIDVIDGGQPSALLSLGVE